MQQSRQVTIPARIVGVVSMLVVLAASGGPASGADAKPQLDAALGEARSAVQRAVESFFVLAERGDWDGVGDLMAREFVLYTDGAVEFGKDDYVALLAGEDMTVESWRLRDVEVFVAPEGTMAFARYRGDFETRVGEEASVVETAETLVFSRARPEGPWRIVHAHASIKPAEAPEPAGSSR